jgi:hypothetical protein
MNKLKFGIANPCCECGTPTKKIEWIKGQQKALCENCKEKLKCQ